jgi:hypothetical protein
VDTDWTRFDYYQEWIQRLGVTQDDDNHDILRPLEICEVHSDVYRAMTAYRPIRVFVPNLQSWISTQYSPHFFPFIDAFIGPNLKDVTMECRALPDDDQSLLNVSLPLLSFGRLSTRIQSLTFDHEDAGMLYKMLFDLVILLPNLRRLALSTITVNQDTIVSLGRLPFLEAISDVQLDQQEDAYLFVTLNGRFPSLIELGVTVAKLAIAVTLSEVMQRPLQTLSIMVLDKIDSDFPAQLSLFQRLLQALRQYHRPLLKKFTIMIPPTRPHQQSKDLTVAGVLGPLLSLSSLECLLMTTPFSQHLDDIWLAQVATSWPHLVSISITDTFPSPRKPNFSLKGLIPLIAECRQLDEFVMRLDLTPVPIPLLRGVCNPRIKHIVVNAGSSLSYPSPAFRSLITMFPNLIDTVCIDAHPDTAMGMNFEQLRASLRSTWPKDSYD